jgi:hypothetical protein
LVVPNFESFGGFDPIGFKLLESCLGGAPAGDGDKHDVLVEIVAMLTDDFAKSASEKIPGDGFSCFFGSDEPKPAVQSRFTFKFAKDEIFSGSRLPPVPNDLKLAPLAHTPFASQSHDWKKIPM